MKKHYDKYVNDEGPESSAILFVGEAPGGDEHEQGRPFIGASGQKLTALLDRAGLSRDECRFANLCHYRPHDNKFENLLGSDALKEGVENLYDWIAAHKSTLFVIVPLGRWPLLFLTGKKGILNWRGSILSYIKDEEIKCIPTLHPSAVLRQAEYYPMVAADMRRIAEDAGFKEKRLPVRKYVIDPRGLELEEAIHECSNAPYNSVDIETVKGTSHILCCGFAPRPDYGVCITTSHDAGKTGIQRLLQAPNRKVFQFGTFDKTQLLELNGYTLNDPDAFALSRPYFWDTMIAQHVQQPELPRSLEFQTSIRTREPYYKHSGKDSIPKDQKGWSSKQNKEDLWIYNCKDVCTDIEIALQQITEISEYPIHQARFDFEMRMLTVAHHIGNSGMYRDEHRVELLRSILLKRWTKKQYVLNRLTGFETNVRSPKLKTILYDKDNLNLPTRRNRNQGITTDEDAIVSLIQHCKSQLDKVTSPKATLEWNVRLNVCKLILEIRGIRVLLSNYIGADNSADNRLRCLYNVSGTETGRWSSSGYPDGTGYNMQTNPRDPLEVQDDDLTVDADNNLVEQLGEEDKLEASAEEEE